MNLTTGLKIGAAAIGVGAGGFVLARAATTSWGERDWTRSYAKHDAAAEQARRTPGADVSPFPLPRDGDNAEYSLAVAAPVIGLVAGGSALAAGVTALTGAAGATRARVALTVVGAALLGAATGGIAGYARGAHNVDAKNGIDVARQGHAAFAAFDRNGDGAISLQRGAAGANPEHLRLVGYDADDAPDYLAGKDALTAADADHSGSVTPAEVATMVASFDLNGDGSIQRTETRGVRSDRAPGLPLLHQFGPVRAN